MLVFFGFTTDEELESDFLANSEPEQEVEEEEISLEEVMEKAVEEGEEPATEVEEPDNTTQDAEVEDSGILSDKERQNEEVNEKDNCSASSISSSSSTLDRETGKGRKTCYSVETGKGTETDERGKTVGERFRSKR